MSSRYERKDLMYIVRSTVAAIAFAALSVAATGTAVMPAFANSTGEPTKPTLSEASAAQLVLRPSELGIAAPQEAKEIKTAGLGCSIFFFVVSFGTATDSNYRYCMQN